MSQIDKIITILCGSFVWGFGFILPIKIQNAISELEK